MSNCKICGGTKKVPVRGVFSGWFANIKKDAKQDLVVEITTTCTCSITRQPIKDNDKTNNSFSEGV